jgi:hypothetical protein
LPPGEGMLLFLLPASGALLFAVPLPGPPVCRALAPGIKHSPGSGAAGAALNKEGKSEHRQAGPMGY